MTLLNNVRIRLTKDHYTTVTSATTQQMDDLVSKMLLLNDGDGVLSIDGLNSTGQLVSWRPSKGWFNFSEDHQDKIRNRINSIAEMNSSDYQHVLHHGGADSIEKLGHGLLEKIILDDEGHEFGVTHFKFKNVTWTQRIPLQDLNFVSENITLSLDDGVEKQEFDVTSAVLSLDEDDIIDGIHDVTSASVDDLHPILLNIILQNTDIDETQGNNLNVEIVDSVCGYLGSPSILIDDKKAIPNDIFEAYDLEQVRDLSNIDLRNKNDLENELKY